MHERSKRQRASTHHPEMEIVLSGHLRAGDKSQTWCFSTAGAAASVLQPQVPCPCVMAWSQQKATIYQAEEVVRRSVASQWYLESRGSASSSFFKCMLFFTGFPGYVFGSFSYWSVWWFEIMLACSSPFFFQKVGSKFHPLITGWT